MARRILILVGIIVAALIFSIAFDMVWGPDANAACRNDDGTNCTTAKQLSKGFKQGEMKNSKKIEFSPRVKKKIRKWIRNHPNSKMARADSWWTWPFEASTCMVWGGDRSECLRKSYPDDGSAARGHERINAAMRETTRVTIKCGGSAIIGAIGGRIDSGRMGWWGAGAGATSCLYQTLGSKAGWW